MSFSLIFFIIIHALSFGYFVELIRRLTRRHREYPLEEKGETLPFGFIKLRYTVLLYIVGYILWVIFSLWLYAKFIM